MLDYDPSFTDAPALDDMPVLPVLRPVADSPALLGADVSPQLPARPKRLSECGGPVAPECGSFVTVAQAAVRLGVSPRRVRALIAAGWLEASRANARLLLIRRSALRAVAVRLPGRPVR